MKITPVICSPFSRQPEGLQLPRGLALGPQNRRLWPAGLPAPFAQRGVPPCRPAVPRRSDLHRPFISVPPSSWPKAVSAVTHCRVSHCLSSPELLRLREPSRFFQATNPGKVTMPPTSGEAKTSIAVSAVTLLQRSDVYSFAIVLYEIYSRFSPGTKVSADIRK